MVTIKSKKEIEYMREAGRVVAVVYDERAKLIKPGKATWEVDQLAEKIRRREGATPAEKGYPSGMRGVPPYPASICISINDEVIHGIPSKNKFIKEGDIVSVDTVALKNGYNGDAARTFMIGNVSKEARRLVSVTEQSFYEGIKYAKPGYRIGDICHAIGEYVRSQGYSVVREFQGHGIGREMHEDPGIPNYGKAGRGLRIEPGMTLAIEPMVIQGRPNILELEDGWTIITEDGSLAAHYENTILVTENEPEILTLL